MTQKIAICSPLHNFVGLNLRNWVMYRQSKKNLLSSNMSSTCLLNMANFGPLAAEIGSGVCGTAANFNGFRVLASLVGRHRSLEVNQSLYDVWPSTGLLHYIYTFGGSCPWRNFATCKNSLCVLLYWQHYCTTFDQWASAKLCGVVEGMESRNVRRRRHILGWAAVTLGIGPHSSFCLLLG